MSREEEETGRPSPCSGSDTSKVFPFDSPTRTRRKPLPPQPHLGEWGWSSENNCTFTPSARPAWGHLIMVGGRNNPMPPSTHDHRRYPVARYTDTGFLDGSMGKESARSAGGGLDTWVRKIPWRRKWQPTPVFFPEKCRGQSSLVGYSPQGCKELRVTERLSTSTQTQTCRHTDNTAGVHSQN